MQETIGERAKKANMSLSDMLRVYAASGRQMTVPLGAEEMRMFARFIDEEWGGDGPNSRRTRYIDELREQAEAGRASVAKMQDAMNALMGEHRKMVRRRRITGACATVAIVATAAWLALLFGR